MTKNWITRKETTMNQIVSNKSGWAVKKAQPNKKPTAKEITMNPDESRKAFEKWWKTTNGYGNNTFSRNPRNTEKYKYADVRKSWQGWQAAMDYRDKIGQHIGEIIDDDGNPIPAHVLLERLRAKIKAKDQP